MKAQHTLIISLILLVAACKKEVIEETTETAPPVSVDAPVPCTGDTWDPAPAYVGIKEVPYFVYNNKAYFINNTQGTSPFQNTMRIYDGVNWQSHSIPPPPFGLSSSDDDKRITFVIGDKGYMGNTGGGQNFAEYSFATHTWVLKESFPGIPRTHSSVFVIGNKAYVAAGRDQSLFDNDNLNDCWEYDPVDDEWTQKASFRNIGRSGAVGFSIGNKGYIVNGNVLFPNDFLLYLHELLEYNPATDSWSTKTPFPGTERSNSQVFVISGKAYVGGGSQWPTKFQDFYRYTQSSNTWTRIQDIPVLNRLITGFALGSKGYILWRYPEGNDRFDKYTPKVCAPVSPGGIILNN